MLVLVPGGAIKFFGGDVRSGSHFLNQEIDATIYLFCCGSIGFCCFFFRIKKNRKVKSDLVGAVKKVWFRFQK